MRKTVSSILHFAIDQFHFLGHVSWSATNVGKAYDDEDGGFKTIAITRCVCINMFKLAHTLDFYHMVYLEQINDVTFMVNGRLATHRMPVTVIFKRKCPSFARSIEIPCQIILNSVTWN